LVARLDLELFDVMPENEFCSKIIRDTRVYDNETLALLSARGLEW
jgi:hypothetical protein